MLLRAAQFTDFENAAFSVFAALINRVVLFFDLNMYIPLSKVDENMHRAHQRNAAVEQKFFFRKFVTPLPETCPDDYGSEDPDCVEEMTMHDILMGKVCAWSRARHARSTTHSLCGGCMFRAHTSPASSRSF